MCAGGSDVKGPSSPGVDSWKRWPEWSSLSKSEYLPKTPLKRTEEETMGQVMLPHQAAGRIDMIDNPIEQGHGVESSLDRFREQSFFAEECLDLLAALREDPENRVIFRRSGHRQAWLEDIIHQREILEQMSDVLLSWETVGGASADSPPCTCR
jgi:hypothetical protein